MCYSTPSLQPVLVTYCICVYVYYLKHYHYVMDKCIRLIGDLSVNQSLKSVIIVLLVLLKPHHQDEVHSTMLLVL